jgi:GNAT superfamily N-acetyltransferase
MAEAWCRSIRELCTNDHRNEPEIIAAWTRNKTPEKLAEGLEDRKLSWFVAVVDPSQAIAGIGMVGSDGTIRAIYVHPEYVNRGVGSLLLRAIEKETTHQGHAALRLESTATAHSFYRKRGFLDSGPAVDRFGVSAQPMEKKLTNRAGPAARS